MSTQIKTYETLRIEISGELYSSDINKLLTSINKLYAYQLLLTITLEAISKLEFEFKNQDYTKLPLFKGIKKDFFIKGLEIFQENLFTQSKTYIIRELKISQKIKEDLKIKSIQYNSPGNIDFLGIGKIFEVIKELIIYYIPNRKSKIEREILEQDLSIKKEELISRKIENLKRLGLKDHEITIILGLQYAEAEKLKNLINKGIIVDIKVLDN